MREERTNRGPPETILAIAQVQLNVADRVSTNLRPVLAQRRSEPVVDDGRFGVSESKSRQLDAPGEVEVLTCCDQGLVEAVHRMEHRRPHREVAAGSIRKKVALETLRRRLHRPSTVGSGRVHQRCVQRATDEIAGRSRCHQRAQPLGPDDVVRVAECQELAVRSSCAYIACVRYAGGVGRIDISHANPTGGRPRTQELLQSIG